MNNKFEVLKVKNKSFVVKLDYNPITDDYDYHMYIRHLVTPEQAIFAYFNKTSELYNPKYDRYELYCKESDICVYYTFLKEKNILLITAFFKGE